jgi:hypothetical protein
MSGPFGKIVHKTCCCDTACPGCCVPAYSDNTPLDIPFEISAPACAELDGFASVFEPSAPGPSATTGPCGVCGIYRARDLTSDVRGAAYNPPAPCTLLAPPVHDPCRFGPWRFSLHCDTPLGLTDNAALDSCCRRLRLGVAFIDDVVYRYIAPTSCSCDPLSAIFSLSDLIDVTWLDPGVTCAIDGCFPSACSLVGAELVI